MKFLTLGAPSDYFNGLNFILKKLNHKVTAYPIPEFIESLSWIKRKEHYWNLDNHIFEKYVTKQGTNIKNIYDMTKPDIILIFNTYLISPETM